MKNYITPQTEDVKLDPLMQTLDVAKVSTPQQQTADAPSRGGDFMPL